MSASLVGSEMCIRDSGSECPTPIGMPSSQRICLHRGGPTQALGGEWGSCLLYTSDAADDM
eukprot:12223214-Alexandrium_andersonii.AAC.1